MSPQLQVFIPCFSWKALFLLRPYFVEQGISQQRECNRPREWHTACGQQELQTLFQYPLASVLESAKSFSAIDPEKPRYTIHLESYTLTIASGPIQRSFLRLRGQKRSKRSLKSSTTESGTPNLVKLFIVGFELLCQKKASPLTIISATPIDLSYCDS